MWEVVNGMTDRVRHRFVPARRPNVAAMTAAALVGASVGIAAWETLRRAQLWGRNSADAQAQRIAEEVMDSLEE
ncbi:hypothetical protein [Alicyclobacillus cellulosilyticus]|nr:hypothetical protein [Alicyclobacillus cellulosilyticus]